MHMTVHRAERRRIVRLREMYVNSTYHPDMLSLTEIRNGL